MAEALQAFVLLHVSSSLGLATTIASLAARSYLIYHRLSSVLTHRGSFDRPITSIETREAFASRSLRRRRWRPGPRCVVSPQN